MSSRKSIGLVAHDNRKQDLVEWVAFNAGLLLEHRLVCTGTTGRLVRETLESKIASDTELTDATLDMLVLKSDPLGGDQQLGAMIADELIDMLIFLWDPMEPHPHDVDVKALLRITVLYNVPIACNRATADFLISSPLLGTTYAPLQKDYGAYIRREVERE